MNYEVRWKRTARDQLADIWVNAIDRRAVSDAANAIDRMLERNPESRGESRPQGRRILIVLPLAVVFRVDQQGMKVTVLSARSL